MRISDFKLLSCIWCFLLCWFGLLLSGCSLFPDKEKDYKYSQEIPELSMPPEIASKPLATDDKLGTNQVGSRQESVKTLEQINQNTNDPVQEQPEQIIEIEDAESSTSQTPISDEGLEIKHQQVDGKVPHLEINRGFDQSWRIVAKALGRAGLEIMDRSYSKAVFYVKYGEKPPKINDGSIWDEVVFFFGGDPYEEETYHVQLSEQNLQQTFVIVADEDDEPLMEEEGIELLKLIDDTIKKYFTK